MIYGCNTSDIKKINYEGYDIKSVYACDGSLVWSSGDTPTPPTGTKLTYRTYGGNTYTIDCNYSSTLSQAEVQESMRKNGVVPNPLYNYSITEVEIGECVTVIGNNAFNDLYSISSATIPNSVTEIGRQAFKNNALSSITIPSSVTSIGVYAFNYCYNIPSVEIPSGVTTIGMYTFSSCIRLTDIVLPPTITSIGDGAFSLDTYASSDSRYSAATYTSTHREVKIYATTPPTIGANVFTVGGDSDSSLYKIYVPYESVDAYKAAWTYYADRIEPIPQPLTFVAQESGTFSFTNPINYSLDNGSTWTELASGTSSPTVASGQKIMWKAELTPATYNGIGKFSSTANFTAEGNAMSLLYGDNFSGQTSLSGKNYAFSYLFSGCTNLTSAENLSLLATTLADYCYYRMFIGCTSLTTASVLPATTLANSCYQNMFRGCTSLTTAPVLSATTLANHCYEGMFYYCTSLTTAPVLSATTLANYCYNGMFQGCTSLTTAPVLSATTLAASCYRSMFSGCTSLTTAPELLATTLLQSCYQNMFRGCTSLAYIKCLATDISASSCTSSWVDNVSSSGTFVKASSANWGSGKDGIPSGWSVVDA